MDERFWNIAVNSPSKAGPELGGLESITRASMDPLVRGSIELLREDKRGVDARSREVCERDLHDRLLKIYKLSGGRRSDVIQLVQLDLMLEEAARDNG